jgi:endonuclease YncB( thermonuclease family)
MYEYAAVIRSIYDGDTCRADVDLGFGVWISDMALRLLGIDAPELGKPGGKEARDFLRELMPIGSTVTIRTHKDATEKYGRMLAEIWDDDTMPSLNAVMVASGHAVPYDGGARG